jgi:hypothetical protein
LKEVRQAVAFALVLSVAATWQVSVAAADLPKDRELMKLEGLAASAKPGLAADGLLRLADLAKDRDKKLDLIQRADDLAATVTPEFPTVPVPVGFTDRWPRSHRVFRSTAYRCNSGQFARC